MTVDVASHSGTLFELRSREVDFHGSLFELHAQGNSSSMIKTIANGITIFELSSSGHLTTQGLRMLSAGIQIESGGAHVRVCLLFVCLFVYFFFLPVSFVQIIYFIDFLLALLFLQINSGGLSVRGGLTVESGGLSLPGQHFALGSLSIETDAENKGSPILQASATNPYFTGSMVELSTSSASSDFEFLALRNTNGEKVLSVLGDGAISTDGGIKLKGPGNLHVLSKSILQGAVSLPRNRVSAGSHIYIKATESTYFFIEDDGLRSSNELVISGHDDGVVDGQLLMISNFDEQQTRGAWEIPSHSTVLLIFSGDKWVDVQALKAPMTVRFCNKIQTVFLLLLLLLLLKLSFSSFFFCV